MPLAPSMRSMGNDDRASRPGAVPTAPVLTDDEIARIEARNGLRQFDRMIEMIDAAIVPGAPRFRLRPSALMELNRYAVEGLMVAPGAFRHGPIGITGTEHQPPPAEDVPRHVDDMCEYVESHWDASPVHLSAYLLWRLNWIHPFNDGNGRTSRVVSYLTLCARLGMRLPGTNTIPERIAANKAPYYGSLDLADAAWQQGRLDVSAMEQLLSDNLAAQLVEIHQAATNRT
jgi:Fic family protein